MSLRVKAALRRLSRGSRDSMATDDPQAFAITAAPENFDTLGSSTIGDRISRTLCRDNGSRLRRLFPEIRTIPPSSITNPARLLDSIIFQSAKYGRASCLMVAIEEAQSFETFRAMLKRALAASIFHVNTFSILYPRVVSEIGVLTEEQPAQLSDDFCFELLVIGTYGLYDVVKPIAPEILRLLLPPAVRYGWEHFSQSAEILARIIEITERTVDIMFEAIDVFGDDLLDSLIRDRIDARKTFKTEKSIKFLLRHDAMFRLATLQALPEVDALILEGIDQRTLFALGSVAPSTVITTANLEFIGNRFGETAAIKCDLGDEISCNKAVMALRSPLFREYATRPLSIHDRPPFEMNCKEHSAATIEALVKVARQGVDDVEWRNNAYIHLYRTRFERFERACSLLKALHELQIWDVKSHLADWLVVNYDDQILALDQSEARPLWDLLQGDSKYPDKFELLSRRLFPEREGAVEST